MFKKIIFETKSNTIVEKQRTALIVFLTGITFCWQEEIFYMEITHHFVKWYWLLNFWTIFQLFYLFICLFIHTRLFIHLIAKFSHKSHLGSKNAFIQKYKIHQKK